MASRTTPIENKNQLVEYIASGCTPEQDWRIGTEHEKFGFHNSDFSPLAYDGESGIRAVLEGLAEFGWEPQNEAGVPIALKKNGCSVTLEPGGQLELSGAPLSTIHETCREVNQHLKEVKEISERLDIGFLGMGFHPSRKREEIPWMPKQRYRIMRNYMPKVGTLGLDMMVRTCTVQVNLDFSTEADMVKKFRTSLALQPIATALFANSPFAEGKPVGFQSYRSQVWTDTDPNRAGMLPFVFESGMGFERWVDYMLDVPMYFVYRDGEYLDAAGLSFRDFMNGKLPLLPGQIPTISDWEDHLTTVFPEVRLKKFLEMRGADGGPWRRLCALPAFWVGLLYDSVALDDAYQLVKDWSATEREQLRQDVPRLGLKAEIHGRDLLSVTRDVLDIATRGLANRRRLTASGDDETGFLNPLFEIVQRGTTPAEEKIRCYHEEWNQSVDPLFTECAY